MRPTPAELISSVRRILRDVIEPELGSDYARARLAEVRAVLAQVDWDDAGIHLARETTALRGLLTDVRSWVDSDERRKVHFGHLSDGLAVDADEPVDDFAGYNERHASYAAVVVALIDPLEDWLRDNPGDTTGHELRRELLARSRG